VEFLWLVHGELDARHKPFVSRYHKLKSGRDVHLSPTEHTAGRFRVRSRGFLEIDPWLELHQSLRYLVPPLGNRESDLTFHGAKQFE